MEMNFIKTIILFLIYSSNLFGKTAQATPKPITNKNETVIGFADSPQAGSVKFNPKKISFAAPSPLKDNPEQLELEIPDFDFFGKTKRTFRSAKPKIETTSQKSITDSTFRSAAKRFGSLNKLQTMKMPSKLGAEDPFGIDNSLLSDLKRVAKTRSTTPTTVTKRIASSAESQKTVATSESTVSAQIPEITTHLMKSHSTVPKSEITVSAHVSGNTANFTESQTTVPTSESTVSVPTTQSTVTVHTSPLESNTHQPKSHTTVPTSNIIFRRSDLVPPGQFKISKNHLNINLSEEQPIAHKNSGHQIDLSEPDQFNRFSNQSQTPDSEHIVENQSSVLSSQTTVSAQTSESTTHPTESQTTVPASDSTVPAHLSLWESTHVSDSATQPSTPFIESTVSVHSSENMLNLTESNIPVPTSNGKLMMSRLVPPRQFKLHANHLKINLSVEEPIGHKNSGHQIDLSDPDQLKLFTNQSQTPDSENHTTVSSSQSTVSAQTPEITTHQPESHSIVPTSESPVSAHVSTHLPEAQPTTPFLDNTVSGHITDSATHPTESHSTVATPESTVSAHISESTAHSTVPIPESTVSVQVSEANTEPTSSPTTGSNIDSTVHVLETTSKQSVESGKVNCIKPDNPELAKIAEADKNNWVHSHPGADLPKDEITIDDFKNPIQTRLF